MQTPETVTITNNGATISMTGDYTQIANFLLGLSQAAAQSAPVANNEPVELAPFHAFLAVELTPYFGAAGATFIVSKLKLGRECNDFRYLIPVYRLVKGDLQKLQSVRHVLQWQQCHASANKTTAHRLIAPPWCHDCI